MNEPWYLKVTQFASLMLGLAIVILCVLLIEPILQAVHTGQAGLLWIMVGVGFAFLTILALCIAVNYQHRLLTKLHRELRHLERRLGPRDHEPDKAAVPLDRP
jgi:membrane protein implicated in regulation of membrane protease activity